MKHPRVASEAKSFAWCGPNKRGKEKKNFKCGGHYFQDYFPWTLIYSFPIILFNVDGEFLATDTVESEPITWCEFIESLFDEI